MILPFKIITSMKYVSCRFRFLLTLPLFRLKRITHVLHIVLSDFIGDPNAYTKGNGAVEDFRINRDDAPSKINKGFPGMDNMPTENDGTLSKITLGVSIPVTLFIVVVMISVILAANR